MLIDVNDRRHRSGRSDSTVGNRVDVSIGPHLLRQHATSPNL